MCKRKSKTQAKLTSNLREPQPRIAKTRKRLVSFSTADALKYTEQRNARIARNVKAALKKLSGMGGEDAKRGLMSALNIVSQKQIICSAMNIPSIQNMLVSRKQLLEHPLPLCPPMTQNSPSCLSIQSTPSYNLLQSEPDLMLAYICLVEKALHNLGIALNAKQNQILVKGVWNVVVKYWSDQGEGLEYGELGGKVQWGLLELLGFELGVGRRERLAMEDRIKSLAFLNQ